MKIVLQGSKVYGSYDKETIEEIKQILARAKALAKGDLEEAIMWIATKDHFQTKDELKELDKAAKMIRSSVKFLTSEFVLVEGSEKEEIGAGE